MMGGKDTTNNITLSSSSTFTSKLSRSTIIDLKSFRYFWTGVPSAILKVYNLSFKRSCLRDSSSCRVPPAEPKDPVQLSCQATLVRHVAPNTTVWQTVPFPPVLSICSPSANHASFSVAPPIVILSPY